MYLEKTTEPNSAYGYIRKGIKIKNNFFKVEKFLKNQKFLSQKDF